MSLGRVNALAEVLKVHDSLASMLGLDTVRFSVIACCSSKMQSCCEPVFKTLCPA